MEPIIQPLPGPYKQLELILRICMAIIAAHIIVVNGTGYDIFELLLIRGYYIEMGFSLVVALIITFWVHFVSNRLDKGFSWESHLVARVFLQALLGILMPVLIEFFMVAFYFWSRARISVLRTPFMSREFRLVIFMICFFNLYCVARYFIIKWWVTQKELDFYRQQLLEAAPEQEPALPQPLPNAVPEINDGTDGPTTPPVFIVHTATRSYPITFDEVAYFYRSSGHVFLRPFTGQDVIVDQSLDQIELQLDRQAFFRVARHMIISRRSAVDYRPLSFGKIGLTLRPPYRERVTASKIQAHDFRLWIKGEIPEEHHAQCDINSKLLH